MRTFILMSALPGSGKSTWAHRYADSHPHTRVISSDDERGRYFNDPTLFTPKTEAILWPLIWQDVHQAGKEENSTVIMDATFLTNAKRKDAFERTPDFDKHILVYFDFSFEEAEKQNAGRVPEKIIALPIMEGLEKEREFPSPEIFALYDEVIVVHPSDLPANLNKSS